MKLSPERLEAVTQKAEDAFWSVIVAEFPEATSGDLSPLTTIRMIEAMKAAVSEWVWANCP